MTTQWKIGIDWTRKGGICWDAVPGDALNILPQPIRYTTLDWRSFFCPAFRTNVLTNVVPFVQHGARQIC